MAMASLIKPCHLSGRQARSFDPDVIERKTTREHLLCILSEKPAPNAFLPSVRGVTFNSQGWVNLRTIRFPPHR
ncbi:hypothetical protein [Cohnella zeiphila]|uniref:Uncharacterized protein n=1 Tax=Cohnella zeiphila TaxID=2761120 RepID=A0A7X0VWB6_9BACL|nr:hypothetical protein [Cohnella zeiphila]MBB6730778.1 hypothetical protein [Cohnella zeiphila]